ncbi:hypothetical protein [Methylobacterium trifolii]|uniref:Uncharacterized protein n=1 Tax=Methylobacterium trifolii TaxID=1003092 RepID=A0ABQ4U1R3_9HYPH|nr:hypothetical protein [Methylobacterium trifolii]GJE61104.1 hypothetical protein MPOCJGCO_3225 [Methylobacterium trifolii]
MRIMPSILTMFSVQKNASFSRTGKNGRIRIHAAHREDHARIYPTGQSYTWGGPTTASNGFAPAIGYDAYHGGNGY